MGYCFCYQDNHLKEKPKHWKQFYYLLRVASMKFIEKYPRVSVGDVLVEEAKHTVVLEERISGLNHDKAVFPRYK